MHPHVRARWQIHFCVILWGFTAILGKLITLGALGLVWWRMLIVAVALLLAPRMWRGLKQLPPRLIAVYAGIGAVVALHWVTFYGAIKLANASVAASCLALAPVFLAVIEPWISRQPHKSSELWLGILVVPGVVLVVGGTPDSMNSGIAIGALSAFFVAAFAALNKRFIASTDALTVTWIEMSAGVLFLTLAIPLLEPGIGDIRHFDGSEMANVPNFPLPGRADTVHLLVLALGCTLLPFALSLVALRHLSAFETQLAINLEPVYAIVLAMLLFGEQRELSMGFYLGVAIILAAVLVYPLLARR